MSPDIYSAVFDARFMQWWPLLVPAVIYLVASAKAIIKDFKRFDEDVVDDCSPAIAATIGAILGAFIGWVDTQTSGPGFGALFGLFTGITSVGLHAGVTKTVQVLRPGGPDVPTV